MRVTRFVYFFLSKSLYTYIREAVRKIKTQNNRSRPSVSKITSVDTRISGFVSTPETE